MIAFTFSWYNSWWWYDVFKSIYIISVQFSLSVMSDSATPWTAACLASLSITNSRSPPISCPLSWWCHPTVSSSVVPFSSYVHSFPASGSFQMSQLFTSGGQSVGVSASVSVLPMNTQDWSPLGWTGCSGLISFRIDWVDCLAVQGTLKSLPNSIIQKY